MRLTHDSGGAHGRVRCGSTVEGLAYRSKRWHTVIRGGREGAPGDGGHEVHQGKVFMRQV
ncbi:hypothetical protein AMTR_s00075p00117190 [Amborella trichopoda]|uniref:Uncharacterized protein n=1 Tax=Amborella trichopoda TaxID=13333 RepID=W1P3Y6_AMBTC|nr:hypothetical protein AMTR_s00075p00117190 [Amborella trichopoda]